MQDFITVHIYGEACHMEIPSQGTTLALITPLGI